MEKKVGKLLFKQCMVFNEAFPTIKDVKPRVNYKTNIKPELLSEFYFCLPDITVPSWHRYLVSAKQ